MNIPDTPANQFIPYVNPTNQNGNDWGRFTLSGDAVATKVFDGHRERANGDYYQFMVEVKFANQPGNVTITFPKSNWRNGAGQDVTFKVEVVQVQVRNPTNGAAFTPNPVPIMNFRATDPFNTGSNRAAVAISSGLPKGDPKTIGLTWAANVTLKGPNGDQGLNKIQVGFIQHVTTSLQVTYKNGTKLTAKYKGKPLSAYVARLDSSPDMPWYSNAPSGLINGAPNNNPIPITSNDSPGFTVPLTSDLARPGVLSQNTWPKENLVTTVTFKDTFSLDVAARTTDGSNNASNSYFAEASGNWSFDGSGAFTLNLKDPAIDSTLTFIADNKKAVIDPGAWTAVAVVTPENISNPTPADWFKNRVFSFR